MSRTILFRSPNLPYHVCAHSNNKDWFYLPTKEVWTIFSKLLGKVATDFSIRIHAFVLMSNHFHALVTTPDENLDTAMLYFMRESAREINKKLGSINSIFTEPYQWSLITHRRYYEHAIRYVYQNPLKAGIVSRVENYFFSTLSHLYSKRKLPFSISESVFDRQGVMDLALWQKIHYLNSLYTKEENDCIRRALGHPVFRLKKSKYVNPTRAQPKKQSKTEMKNLLHYG